MGAGSCWCWECLVPPFSGPSCLSPCGHLVPVFLSLPSHSNSASVLDSLYVFSDLFLQYSLFMREESLHKQSPVVLWTGGQRFLQKPPKIAMNVSLLFASM